METPFSWQFMSIITPKSRFRQGDECHDTWRFSGAGKSSEIMGFNTTLDGLVMSSELENTGVTFFLDTCKYQFDGILGPAMMGSWPKASEKISVDGPRHGSPFRFCGDTLSPSLCVCLQVTFGDFGVVFVWTCFWGALRCQYLDPLFLGPHLPQW